MRRILVIAAISIVALFSVSSMSKNDSLKKMWEDYERAYKADKPKTQLELLSKIIEHTESKRLSWDWWKAQTKYNEASIMRDWKQREVMEDRLRKAVEAYGDPIVTFELMARDWELNVDSLDVAGLKKGKNTEFWNNSVGVANQMSKQLPKYISNDYEYALWRIWLTGQNCYEQLALCVGERYPNRAWLEYQNAQRKPWDEREAALKKVAEEYSGRGVGFWAKRDLLQREVVDLRENGKSDDFIGLLQRCKSFEKERKELKDAELMIAKDASVDMLIKELNSKELGVAVEKDSIIVSFRNLTKAIVDIYPEGSKKSVFTKEVFNSINSFYAIDEAIIALPSLNDGQYIISVKNGTVESQTNLEKFSLSLAYRKNKSGYGIYVTDWKSGQPVSKANIEIYKNGKSVSSLAGLKLEEGFTSLPANFINDTNNKDIQVSFQDGDCLRKSRKMGLYEYPQPGVKKEYRSELIIDRGAYHPGDTVSFKAIVWYEDGDARVLENQSAEAILYDAEGKKIQSQTLKTNEFGSAAGCFKIPVDRRNGLFYIKLISPANNTYKHFRVDEFVLPTFDLTFEDNDRTLYLPGDTVKVSGKVISNSGHNLSSAKMSFVATGLKESVLEGAVALNGDGNFEIDVPTMADRQWRNIVLTVKVVDETGETQEFNKHILLAPNIEVRSEILNHDNGSEVELIDGFATVISENHIQTKLSVRNRDDKECDGEILYFLYDEKRNMIESGRAESGQEVSVALLSPGLYVLESCVSAKAQSGEVYTDTLRQNIISFPKDAATLSAPVKCLYRPIYEGAKVKAQLVSASGPIWAVAEVYGPDKSLLAKKALRLMGNGDVLNIEFERPRDWPSKVKLNLLYFKEGGYKHFVSSFDNSSSLSAELPFEFASFCDNVYPGTDYSIILKTLPNVEAVASIFDKSTERIYAASWSYVRLSQPEFAEVHFSQNPGYVGTHIWSYRKSTSKQGLFTVARTMAITDDAVLCENAMIEAEDSSSPVCAFGGSADEDVAIRENFAKTITFQPFLRSSKDGEIELKFHTADQLSTFIVSVFAHDTGMKNAQIRKEMVVTIPVKVAVSAPKYLYCGDKYEASVVVSSIADVPIKGVLHLYQGSIHQQVALEVGPHQSASALFKVDVPVKPGEIELKAFFVSEGFSDGMLTRISVHEASQIIKEAHSAVLRKGDDKEKLVEKLRGQFANGSGLDASCKEVMLKDLIIEAIPAKISPACGDVLSLMEAYYVGSVASKLGSDLKQDDYLLKRILSCRNADGGFSWFEGMSSSPIITAVMLERFNKLYAQGLGEKVDLASSVKFLDKCMLVPSWPVWYGGLSLEKYLYVRSMYPDVKFDVQVSGSESIYKKQLSEFRKNVKKYLTPHSFRGLNGVLDLKVMRMATLNNLLASNNAKMLAKDLGVGVNMDTKLSNSIRAEAESILEYAVDHEAGGVYYPNLVMPFRGLMEGDAYSHAMLADLLDNMSAERYNNPKFTMVSEGIRLWLMLQKETQKWEDSAEYVDVINSVLSASEDLLETKIVVLESESLMPIEKIKVSGNQMTVEKKYYLERVEDKKVTKAELRSGDVLKVGDKVIAVYMVWSKENRSFVKITSPREATLRPANQISGFYGVGISPLRMSDWFVFRPSAWRNVKFEKTEYYFDAFPEENTVIQEEFFVTQNGEFSAPVIEVESLYAPHYRANDKKKFNILVGGEK